MARPNLRKGSKKPRRSKYAAQPVTVRHKDGKGRTMSQAAFLENQALAKLVAAKREQEGEAGEARRKVTRERFLTMADRAAARREAGLRLGVSD